MMNLRRENQTMINTTVLFLATLTLFSTKIKGDSGFCHVSFSEGNAKCMSEGRYPVESYERCCSAGNATGYSENQSGIKETLKNVFLRKKQTECTSCAHSFSKTKKWCFAYRNPAESNCIHFPGVSTIDAVSQTDCCQWWNASGYTEGPKWKWATGYSRWITSCSSCIKDKFVACFDRFSEDRNGVGQCSGSHPRLATTTHECCSRTNVTGYSRLAKFSASIAGCYPCPVHGGWSEWSEWSPCSSTCGDSHKRRVRSCTHPVPKHKGLPCEGPEEETEKCQVPRQCPESAGTVHTALRGPMAATSWSQWSVFSPCSATCGSGVMERRRKCNQVAADCVGETVEIHPCEAHQPCNVGNVNWMWTAWSPCHQTCGAGVQLRSKLCLVVGLSSGHECEATVETNLCELPPCPSLYVQPGSEVLQRPTDPVSIYVWLVPLVVIVVLAVWAVILFVIIRRRRRLLVDSQSLRGLKRPPMQLPAIPSAPQHYEETYVPMELDRFIDEDGYEIPTDKMSLERKCKGETQHTDDCVDTDAAANHVYEQLHFYQDKSDCLSAPTDIPDDLNMAATKDNDT